MTRHAYSHSSTRKNYSTATTTTITKITTSTMSPTATISVAEAPESADLNAHSSFKLLNTTQSVTLQTENRSNDRADMKIWSEKDEKYEEPILGNMKNETEAKTDLIQDKIPTINNKLNETETELLHIKVPTVEDNKNETETEFIQNKVQAIDNNQIKTVADLFTLDIFSDIDRGTKQI